ncbi:MAG: alpha/beta fold hydrolase [Elstera sp.]
MIRAPIRQWRDLGDGPPIVFLHGWAGSGAFFADQEALANRGLRVIIPDLPGHGPSATPDAALTLADLADALAVFVRARGLVKPVFVGWSMGLLVALEALSRHRISASGLVVLDMAPKPAHGPDWPFGTTSRQTEAEMIATADAMEAEWGEFAPRIAHSLFARGRPPASGWLAEATARIAAQDAPTLAALWRSLARVDSRRALAACGLPLLVLLGAQSRVYGAKLADFYRESYPDADVVSLEGAGHAPQIEQPEAVNSAIAAFVAQIHGVRTAPLELESGAALKAAIAAAAKGADAPARRGLK